MIPTAFSLLVVICLLVANCGKGSSTQAGVPYPPGIVATAGNDSTGVYWTNGDSLLKVGINGGIVTTLATGTIYPFTIAIDSTNVYWADSIGIEKVNKNGGTVTTLISGLSGWLQKMVVDSTSVYWTEMCST